MAIQHQSTHCRVPQSSSVSPWKWDRPCKARTELGHLRLELRDELAGNPLALLVTHDLEDRRVGLGLPELLRHQLAPRLWRQRQPCALGFSALDLARVSPQLPVLDLQTGLAASAAEGFIQARALALFSKS
jgi:hypothetical protein